MRESKQNYLNITLVDVWVKIKPYSWTVLRLKNTKTQPVHEKLKS